MDVISLTKKLLSFNSINPPGNEEEIARFTGSLLSECGFTVAYYPFETGRLHLIAERGLSSDEPPLVFSGHFDTVPLGNQEWSVDPFAGEIIDDKLWGRGSSDMKGGLAAIIIASIEAFKKNPPEGGIRIIVTAGEELGCHGAKQLAGIIDGKGMASAIIVGEPTGNLPATGHKGAIYLNAVTSGLTAHSSMPELGINAIYKAARSILKISNFKFEVEKDPLLGYPTINVGKVSGGLNLNSVPDHAEFTIDIRTTTKSDHNIILARLTEKLGSETVLETLVNLQSVFTPEKDPFVQLVYDQCEVERSEQKFPYALPYLTDGAVLQKLYHGVPTIILGPGQPEMAHKTDEYCYVRSLEQAVVIYENIIKKWNH